MRIFKDKPKDDYLPPRSFSYEEFGIDPEKAFKQAIEELDNQPSFNWRKKKGESLSRKSAQIPDEFKIAPSLMGSVLGGTLGIAAWAFGPDFTSSQLQAAYDITVSQGGIIGGGIAGSLYNPVRKKFYEKLGAALEGNSGYTQVRSDEIDQIKSKLSPSDRHHNLYAADFNGYTEIHGREGIEEMIDTLSEQYPEAMWSVAREEENPFQVVGMTLEEQPETSYEEDEYEQRRRLAEETVEALGSGSVDEILSTDNGVAPNSPRYEDNNFDVVIVDRNPEQSYDPEDNFFDYSDNLSSQPEPAEKNAEHQKEPEAFGN